MAKKFATSIDLLQNELQNAVIHVNISDPLTPSTGQIYYNSTTNVLKFYNGTEWIILGKLNQMTMSGDINANNNTITNLKTPTNANDAATKQYVDTTSQGLDAKLSVKCASTGNITLTAPQTVDGVVLVAGDRVLVKDQTTASTNGIYTVNAGAWTRTTDADTWPELVSAFTFVEQGTTNADTGWLCTVDTTGTLGTTPVTFVQFSAAGQIVGLNVGTGQGIYKGKTGLQLELRSIATPAGQGAVTVSTVGDNIQINTSAKIESIHDLATNGIIVQNGANTVVSRTITKTGDGLSVSNGDGVSGNPTISLTNDIAAVEALSTTGFAVRTGADTWTTRTITAVNGITITGGNGSANPVITIDPNTIHDVSGIVKYWVSTFTFVASGAEIALTHNLNLPAGMFDDYIIRVVETASRTEIETEKGATASTANITHIKMTGTGLSTTAGYYTAIIHA